MGSELIIPFSPPENNPNVLHPHVSEVFPWLGRKEYFQQRDKFVNDNLDKKIQELQKDKECNLNQHPSLIPEAARLLLRSYFVVKYMIAHDPYKSDIPTNIDYWRIKNTHKVVSTIPWWYQNGEYINFDQINTSDIDSVEIRNFFILNNMNRIESNLLDMGNEINEGERMGKNENELLKQRQHEIEKFGIIYESLMAQEVGHVFYIQKAVTSKEEMQKLIKELSSYRTVSNDKEELFTLEDAPFYLNSPIEEDGNVWEKEFMKHYYPDVKIEKNIIQPSEKTK